METPMFDQMLKTAADTYLGQVKQAFDAVSGKAGKLEAAPALREFATRQADAAKARVTAAEQVSLEAATRLENAAVAAAGFGMGLVRSAVEATVANATMAIEAARDIAAAATPQDAIRRHADFLKACGEANLARARDGLAQARDVAADGAKTIQAEAARFADLAAKAA